MRNTHGSGWGHLARVARTGDFSERLSWGERLEFDALRTVYDYPPATTLFVERQAPDNVLFLLTGQVKLSLNSSAGKRTILGVAFPGETLGLASAFSGSPYDITAETVSPCMVASIEREGFIEFLGRHPSAYVDVARELCLECARACEQVRRLGLTVTASEKLVRFLLEQCVVAQQTGRGTRLFCALTHTEIGECIGVARQTVTRLFSDFKCRELLESRGSTLIISDRRALETYAGIE
jgi:CRP/FNR family transcriptional regulator, cyclic AMP receptor protein